MPRRRGLALVLLAAAGSRAAADEGDCRDYGSLAATGPSLATVSAAAPRTYFQRNPGERAGCPGADPACRDKAFLVPGNAVLLGSARGGYACATYVGAKGLVRSGWLPEATLARAPAAPAPAPRDWAGTWTAPEQRIAIRADASGALAVSGEATFGALDPARVKRGAVNLGSLDGRAKPAGPTLAFTMGSGATLPYGEGDPEACRVRLRLVPPFLLAEDNRNCGGMNVSFTGVYRRAGR
ncbi:hypothetical protein OPKNFCMD_1519 [Methylobacterium crusticola]|uniref:Uncharacterized protein n=1 Tax=Methylobacterium crusticola TaxID=1697972 RepID=A0ABQ4QTY8_9HYPH|nr:hypothetical protein [Methylobacterium crusticola]GJD48793.1 hypothetical protein OPKNFCMD_1519 [Methylobacterium crusticola]